MTPFEKRIIAWVALGFAIAFWAWISELDYQDALTQERITCEMVEAGIWPGWQARNLDCPQRVAEINERQR